MNATSVEIQRIQTRLQQLGRPRQGTTPDLHPDSDANSGSPSYLDLPQASPAIKQQVSQLSYPAVGKEVTHIGVNSTLRENLYATNPPAAQSAQSAANTVQDASTFNAYSRSMPRSEIATQARSVHMNEDTMTALRSSALQPESKNRTAGESALGQYTKRQPAIEQHNATYYGADCHTTQTEPNPQRQYRYQEHQDSTTSTPSYPNPFWDSNQPSHSKQTHTSSSVSHTTTPKTRIQEPTITTQASYQADPLIEIFQHLNAQAQQVNLISNTLKVALQEMGSIAQQAERQRSLASVKGHHIPFTTFDASLVCDSQPLTVPQIEQQADGAYVIKALPIGDIGQNHHVEHLAQQLRDRASHRLSKDTPSRGILSGLMQWIWGLCASPPVAQPHIQASHHSPGLETQTMPRERFAATPTSNLPPNTSATAPHPSAPPLMSSIIWVGGSILVRIGLDVLLFAYPMLWPPAIALVVTPAAIAIYRTTINPQSGVLLGRRLLLIMIGLLIGGRL